MSKHIAFLSVAAVLGTGVLPAAAADYYDGGDRFLAFHSRDDVTIEGVRARVEHRVDLRPAYDGRRAPGPVAFDERGYGEPDPRGPGFGYGRPAAFAPEPDRFYGGGDGYGPVGGYRPAPFYRPAAVPVGPAYGGPDFGGVDGGCTVEQARSTTPLGWRKIVTHRTCYRR